MCGTNNLRDEEPDRIANKLVELALTVNERVDKVAVSSIVHRADSHNLEVKRKEVNRLVRESLENHEIDFITHYNIKAQHLNNWGFHLNYNGNNLLAGNFIDFINSTVSLENRPINDEDNLDFSIYVCRPCYKRKLHLLTPDEDVDQIPVQSTTHTEIFPQMSHTLTCLAGPETSPDSLDSNIENSS